MLVAYQEQGALELCGNVYARDRDALGLGQLLYERRRATQALVRRRHKGQLAVVDGSEQLGRHAGFVGLGAGLGGAGTQRLGRSIGQRLVLTHRHGGIAVNVDHQHEHAVVRGVIALGKRPLNVLLGPAEHVMGKRLALHQALGQRANVTVEHGHLFVGHAPTADKRGLVERKLLDRLLIGAKVLVRTLVLGIAKQLCIINLGHGHTFRVSHSVLLYQKDGPPNGAAVFCRDNFRSEAVQGTR